MKKHWFAVLCGGWPYLFLGLFLLTNYLSDRYNIFHVPFFLACGVGFLSIMVGLVSFAFGQKEHDISPQTLSTWALRIKLAHIPYYIVMFLFFLIVPMGFYMFFWFDVMAMFCSGGFGISSVIRCLRAGLLRTGQCIVYVLLNFFFITDVISTYLVWRKLKKQ